MPDFDHLNFGALNRALVQILAELLHLEVTVEELMRKQPASGERGGCPMLAASTRGGKGII